MRRSFTILLASAILTLGTQTALAQYVVDKGPAKKTPAEGKEKDTKKAVETSAPLDQLIGEALANNPDIRIAEANVQTREAELARARLRVISELSMAHAEIKAAQASLEEGEKRHTRAKLLFESGNTNAEDYGLAALTFLKLKAELNSSQAKIPILLGKQPEKTASLDQMIAESRTNNPDIRVGEAKVREGEAELARVRLKVVSDVSLAHGEIEAAKAGAEEGRMRHDRAKTLLANKTISHEDYGAALITFMKLKSELAVMQAKLPYLLGKQPAAKETMLDRTIVEFMLKEASAGIRSDEEFLRRMMLDIDGRLPTPQEMKGFLALPEKGRREMWVDAFLHIRYGKRYRPILADWTLEGMDARIWALHTSPSTPLNDKLRKALDAPITMNLKNAEVKLMEVIEHVQEKGHLQGINVKVRAKSSKTGAVNLREPIPTGAFLQYLEDEYDVVFVLRDYGIVVIAADERLPPGAVLVTDFWKRGKPAEVKPLKKEKADSKRTNPDEEARGLTEKYPALIQVSIGYYRYKESAL